MSVNDLQKFKSIYEGKLLLELRKLPIINPEGVDSIIDRYYIAKTTKPEVKNWFNTVVKNYLLSDQNPDNEKITPEEAANTFGNLPDWANISIEKGQDLYAFYITSLTRVILDNSLDYLNSNDATELLPKLQRITVPQMNELQKKWHLELKKKKISTDVEKLEAKNFKLIYSFADGSKIVQLKTKKAKEVEGDAMGHCVGRGGYDKTTIFSLRDPKGYPHATMEMDGEEIVQLQGKENKDLVEKYWPYIREFISKTEFELADDYLDKIGLIKLNDTVYDINELPEGLDINDKINLSMSSVKKLPNNLTVNGEVDLEYTNLTELPENFTVKGSIDISNTLITKLPKKFEFGSNIYARNSKLIELPENLKVHGVLSLTYSKDLFKLPKGLIVLGDLNLFGTNLTELPDDLIVVGNLNIMETKIKSIPKTARIDGFIYSDFTNNQEEPSRLERLSKNL